MNYLTYKENSHFTSIIGFRCNHSHCFSTSPFCFVVHFYKHKIVIISRKCNLFLTLIISFKTIGKKITALTPTRGFCAEFGAATTILIASKLGLPISTTHCLVGAVLGVGLARGLSALNLGMLKEIVLSWVVTIPASAGMSILCFYILKAIFL